MAHTVNIIFFIVEDDPMFIKLMKGLVDNLEQDFKKRGHELSVRTFTFDKLNDAQTALKNHNPDIILLDYYLVDENNKSVTSDKFLKDALEFNPDIKIIVVSGESEKDIVHKLKETGAAFYIAKQPKTLIRLVPTLKMMIQKLLDNK